MATNTDEHDITDDFEDDVVDIYDSAESWLERKIADTRDVVREEPIKMLAIAAGIGALIGAVFLR